MGPQQMLVALLSCGSNRMDDRVSSGHVSHIASGLGTLPLRQSQPVPQPLLWPRLRSNPDCPGWQLLTPKQLASRPGKGTDRTF